MRWTSSYLSLRLKNDRYKAGLWLLCLSETRGLGYLPHYNGSNSSFKKLVGKKSEKRRRKNNVITERSSTIFFLFFERDELKHTNISTTFCNIYRDNKRRNKYQIGEDPILIDTLGVSLQRP